MSSDTHHLTNSRNLDFTVPLSKKSNIVYCICIQNDKLILVT